MAADPDVPFVMGNGMQENSGGSNSVFYVTVLALTRQAAIRAHTGIGAGSPQSWSPASVSSPSLEKQGRNFVSHHGVLHQ